MGLSKVSIFCVLVLWVWGEVGLGGESGHGNTYISWNDLWVDEQRLTLKSSEDGGVIVVDQHGRGHSKTVQGAVDMVPDHNTERVKIYIYPGIYRYRLYSNEASILLNT